MKGWRDSVSDCGLVYLSACRTASQGQVRRGQFAFLRLWRTAGHYRDFTVHSLFVFQLRANGRDVIRSRDANHSFALTNGQITAQQVRAKIVSDMLTSERVYVKLLRDIIEVRMNWVQFRHLYSTNSRRGKCAVSRASQTVFFEGANRSV